MSHIISFNGITPCIHPSAFIAETAVVIGDVEIGEGSSIWYNTVLRGDSNAIRVGKYTNIQDNSTVHIESDQPIHIGDYVLIGHNAIIHGAKVGKGCLIGMGTVLMSYSEIGENCIIGAGTLITEHKKIPPNSLVYGTPARIVRTLGEEEIGHVRGTVMEYSELAKKFMEK